MKWINEVLKMKDTKQKGSYLLKWYLAVRKVVLVLKAFILKIAFNLFVMRSCFSRKKSQLPVKENDSFDKDFFWILDLGITTPESYYRTKDYYLSHILPKQDEINSCEIVLGEGDEFPPFPYKPFLL